jgi:hypothetical protein
MKTHIDATHAHLLTKRKLKLTNIVATKHFDINHNQQLGEKKGCIVWVCNHNIFLAQEILISMVMKHNNHFWKIWSFTFAKDTKFCQHLKTYGCKY